MSDPEVEGQGQHIRTLRVAPRKVIGGVEPLLLEPEVQKVPQPALVAAWVIVQRAGRLVHVLQCQPRCSHVSPCRQSVEMHHVAVRAPLCAIVELQRLEGQRRTAVNEVQEAQRVGISSDRRADFTVAQHA